MSNQNNKFLILAAGSSSRLGRPKQLLKMKGEYLLSKIIRVTQNFGEAMVVLGANAEQILKYLEPKNYIINEAWQAGMGASLAYGISQPFFKEAEDVIICLSDQPLLDTSFFEEFLSKIKQSSKEIVNTKYETAYGPPVYFSRKYFKDLESLSGDQGAQILVKKYKSQVDSFVSYKAGFDIDTSSDLLKIKGLKFSW